MDFKQKFPMGEVARTVEYRKCWWVYFDVNGNAPSDVDVVACATKEMAEEVKGWFSAMKDDDAQPYVVIDGKKYQELPSYSVEGYNFDTYYAVREGVAEADEIRCSIEEVVKNTFEFNEDTDEKDGVYLGEPAEEE